MKATARILLSTIALVLGTAACGGDSAEPDAVPSTSTGQQTTSTTPTTEDQTTTSTSTTELATTSTATVSTTTTIGGELAGDVRIVEITMTDFAFEPDRVDVRANEIVRFVVINEGLIDHELRLSNPHRIEEHLASDHGDHGDHEDEGGHHEEGGDLFIELQPGETGELVVDFPEDTTIYTEMVCLLPGHYEAGMIGDLMYEDQ